MNSFSRFQARNKARTVAEQKLNTSFIFQGYPSIKIKNLEKEIQAAVVNKQEKDIAYIYTQLSDHLEIGSIWEAKNLKLLISQEFTIIKDVNWHKYHAFLCNIKIGNEWGYFKGPGKSFLDILLEQKVVLDSPQKPVLVLANNILDFKDKIVIGGRAWIVQEYDTITTPGLVYYSLKPTTISKQNESNEGYIEKHQDIQYQPTPVNLSLQEENLVSFNTPITLTTEDGYFKKYNNIKILKHNETEIIFEIPFGVSEVRVDVKENNEIITRTFKAVK